MATNAFLPHTHRRTGTPAREGLVRPAWDRAATGTETTSLQRLRLRPATHLSTWRRLGVYTGAGLVSGAVNLILFHVVLQAHATPHLAWAIAFEVGTLVAFGLHRYVTWRDRLVRTRRALLGQFGRAQMGTITTMVVSLAIFTLLVRAGLPAEVDDVAGLGVGFALNFALAHHFIYGPDRHYERWHRPGRTRGCAGTLHR